MRPPEGLRRLSSNRPLAAVVAVSAVSGLGDWMYLTVLPILIYQRTGDAAMVGLMGAARLLPAVVLSMPAGWLADRVSPRSIMLISETIRGLAMAIVAGLTFVSGDIWLILVVAMAAAAAGTFYSPASMVLMPRLARDDQELGRANSAFAGLDGIANIVGPAIGAILVVSGGLPPAFVLNALTFAVMVLVVAAVVPRANRVLVAVEADQTNGDEAVGLLGIAARIARPLAIDAAISFAATATSVLAVIIAVEVLASGEGFAGALNAAAGIGALVGGLLTGALVNRRDHLGLVLGFAALVPALLALGVGHPAVAMVAMTVAVGSLVLLDTQNTTRIQRLTADGGTGRAFGLLHTLAGAWWAAGSIVPAIVAVTYGPAAAIAVTAGVVLVLGVAGLMPDPRRIVDGPIRVVVRLPAFVAGLPALCQRARSSRHRIAAHWLHTADDPAEGPLIA